jgi:phospholipase/carboxylesterase
MHKKEIISSGKNIQEAEKALVMIHGRGATAQSIIGLAGEFNVKDFALIAPQASNFTWYPHSFLAPPRQNEPWLSAALELLQDIVEDINQAGIPDDHIYFLGFSQGACLTLEFVTRKARKWGGVAALTGGLIGDKIYPEHYTGDFEDTRIFIGTSDPDPHVPVERVKESTDILKTMHAQVTEKVYPGMGHTVNRDEIENINKLLFY